MTQFVRAFAIVSLIVTLALLTCTNLHDLDHGFYLAVGRRMIAQATIPRTEFYLPLLISKPFGSPWLLSALLFAGVWDTLGVAGFIALKATCYTTAFLLAVHAACRRHTPVTVACFCAGIVACAVASRFVERPGFFSALLYGVLLVLIPVRTRLSGGRIIAAISLLLVWPFLHSEWYIGLFLFACLVLSTTANGKTKLLAITCATVLPVLCFSLIHPAGIGPLIAPFKFLAGTTPDFKIREYSADTWTQLWPAIPLLMALVCVAVGLWKSRRFAEAVLLLALVILSIKASRAALPALIIGIPWLTEAAGWLLQRLPGKSRKLIVAFCAALPFFALAWLHNNPQHAPGFRIDPMIDTRGVGKTLASITAIEGPVLAEYGYTSQLLANPSVVRQGVIMDGRQEIYDEFYLNKTYLDCFFAEGANRDAALAKAGIAFYAESWRDAGDIELLPKLRLAGWQLIAWDNSGRVLARPGIAEKYQLTVYTTDPAHLDELKNATRAQLTNALEEIKNHNVELESQNLPAPFPLCAQATLELALGDQSAAAASLEKSRAQGGERLSTYWKTRLVLATTIDDTALMKSTLREQKRRGFKGQAF